MADSKFLSSNNDGLRNTAIEYVPRKQGLYIDALQNEAFVTRQSQATGSDSVVFDPITALGQGPKGIRYEQAQLDFPRRWGGWGLGFINDTRKDLSTGFKMRDWVGRSNGEAHTTLHFVGPVNGLIGPDSVGGMWITDHDYYEEQTWVYRCGRKFAEAPWTVCGAAKYTDSVGRDWLLVSSVHPDYKVWEDTEGEENYPKLVVYYRPWGFAGENPGLTEMWGYDESYPEENRKWRMISTPYVSNVLKPEYSFEDMPNWTLQDTTCYAPMPFSASGSRLLFFTLGYYNVYSADRPKFIDEMQEFDHLNWAMRTPELYILDHKGIGGAAKPTLTLTPVGDDYAPNGTWLGHLAYTDTDYFIRNTAPGGVKTYNGPFSGNEDVDLRAEEYIKYAFRENTTGRGYIIAADWIDEDLSVYTVEPEKQWQSAFSGGGGNFYWNNSYTATISQDVEPTGDFKDPEWNEPETEGEEGYWSCPEGYSHYPGPDGSAGVCAKVWGRNTYIDVVANTADALTDSVVSQYHKASSDDGRYLVIRAYVNGVEHGKPIQIGASSSHGGTYTYSWECVYDDTSKKFKHKFKNFSGYDRMFRSLDYGVIIDNIHLVDPRYHLVVRSKFPELHLSYDIIDMYFDEVVGPVMYQYPLEPTGIIDIDAVAYPNTGTRGYFLAPYLGFSVFKDGVKIINEDRPYSDPMIPYGTPTPNVDAIYTVKDEYDYDSPTYNPWAFYETGIDDYSTGGAPLPPDGWENDFDTLDDYYDSFYGTAPTNTTLLWNGGYNNSLFKRFEDTAYTLPADGPWDNVASTEGFKYVGNGKDLYLFSFRYWNQIGHWPENLKGESHLWVNPSLGSFVGYNMPSDTPIPATSKNPLDVMGVNYASESDDQVTIGNAYLFL